MEMGKTERREESQLVFEEERRGSTKTCPCFSSLLFLSLFSPLFPRQKGWRCRQGATALGLAGGGGEYCSYLLQHGPSPIKLKKLQLRIPNTACRQSNGKYSTISTQPQCPFVHSSNGSKRLILDINFIYSHVESVFCPLFILGVTSLLSFS